MNVSICECGWKLPPIAMRCKMRFVAPEKEAGHMNAAAEAVAALVAVGGRFDFIGIVDVECPVCGTTFTQKGQVVPESMPDTRFLQ